MTTLIKEIEETIEATGCKAVEIARAAEVTPATLCGIRKGYRKNVYAATASKIQSALTFIRIKYGIAKEEKDGE